MMEEFAKDGNALTDPPVYLDWRTDLELFGREDTALDSDMSSRHLTNYQAMIVRLHNTWSANRESAQANGELITKLRKKLKKIKKALKS